jgi:HAD superfamily hydrolase (TIGR01549 family)
MPQNGKSPKGRLRGGEGLLHLARPAAPAYTHPARAGAFILDWDGVLADTKLDFKPLRQKYFGGEIVPLIEAASALPEPARSEVRAEIRRIEMEGAKNAEAVEGAKDLIAWLSGAGAGAGAEKPWAVVSRNCRDSILLAAEKCGIALPSVLLSREDPHVKPAPEALALAAERMGVPLANCVMVGDFVYDMMAANRAGIPAVLVRSRGADWEDLADFSYATVGDFVEALRSFSS